MTTTIKRTTLALTKEDVRLLKKLMKHYGETQSQVFKRALIHLEYDVEEIKARNLMEAEWAK